MSDGASETHEQRKATLLSLNFGDILDTANNAIILTDTNHKILCWNKRAEKIYGFDQEEVAGKSITDTIIPVSRKKRCRRVIESLNRGEPFSGEFLHVGKDGKEIPVHVSVKGVFNKAGQYLGFLAIIADISGIKTKEERLRRRNRELRAFKEITSAVSSPMSTKEVLQRSMQAIVKALSADAGAVFLLNGKSAVFSPFAHDGISERSMEALASPGPESGLTGKVIKSCRGVLIGDAWKRRRKDWILLSTVQEGFRSFVSVPIRGRKQVLGALEVASCRPNHFGQQDLRFLMTVGWQVGGAIENAMLREDLRKSLRSKTRLVREARHRLTNNLQSIASLLSTAVQSEQWTGNGKAVIDSAVQRISGMAAIQQQMDLDGPERIELAEVIERIEGCIREIHGQQHEMTFVARGKGAELSASLASSLAIAINELVWNACAHGFDPGQNGSIMVEASAADGTAKIEVRDNGKGIPDDFDLERDADTGLSIVRNLVERDLNGRLSIARREGTVATMTWTVSCEPSD